MSAEDKVHFGNIRIIPRHQSAYYKQNRIPLRRKEYQLLEFMARNKDRVINRLTILEYVWNYNTCANTNTLEVHINNLRKKLEKYKSGKNIKTVHGLGYVLCDD